jgi:hypothetical protein
MGANASSRPDKGAGCYGNGRLKVILSIYTLGRIYVVIFAEVRELYMTVRCQGVGMLYSVQAIYENPIAPASRQILHSYSIQYVWIKIIFWCQKSSPEVNNGESTPYTDREAERSYVKKIDYIVLPVLCLVSILSLNFYQKTLLINNFSCDEDVLFWLHGPSMYSDLMLPAKPANGTRAI